MALTECGRGHMYDPDVYNMCPYCNPGQAAAKGGQRVGIPVVAEGNRTAPVQHPANQAGSGVGISIADANKTLPPRGYGAPAGKAVTDDNKTVGMMKQSLGVDPVVGWLVCVKGKDKGKSFELKGRINSIGRAKSMDICLSGDMTISNENHARVGYSERGNAFHLIPADSKNVIYLNDEPIYMPTPLKPFDRIAFGETEVLFQALCGDNFSWAAAEEADKGGRG